MDIGATPGPPAPPGLPALRVAPGGRYFETVGAGGGAGVPFLFIGPNDAVTWPGLAGLYRRRDVASVEAYLGELADSGVTVLRLMLEYAHREGRYLERPAGTFNPAMVRLPERAPMCDVPLVVGGMAPGAHRILAWDTAAGHAVARLGHDVGSDGELRVVLPALDNDVAFAVGPAPG